MANLNRLTIWNWRNKAVYGEIGNIVSTRLPLVKASGGWHNLVMFAHTNAPDSEREKRWQDVEAILEAGINILTMVNVSALKA